MTAIAVTAGVAADEARKSGTIVEEEGAIEAEETVVKTVAGNGAAKRALVGRGTIIVTSEPGDELNKVWRTEKRKHLI